MKSCSTGQGRGFEGFGGVGGWQDVIRELEGMAVPCRVVVKHMDLGG